MSTDNPTSMELSSVKIDEDRFVQLLTKLIDNVSSLQNNPSQVQQRTRIYSSIPQIEHRSLYAQVQTMLPVRSV